MKIPILLIVSALLCGCDNKPPPIPEGEKPIQTNMKSVRRLALAAWTNGVQLGAVIEMRNRQTNGIPLTTEDLCRLAWESSLSEGIREVAGETNLNR